MGTTALNITINFEALEKLGLSIEEYATASFITQECANPSNIANGWCLISKKQIAKILHLSERTTYRILKKLWDKKLIERYSDSEKSYPLIRTTQKWYDCTIGIPTAKMAEPLPKSLKEKVAPKENIYITTPSEREGTQKRPSCPLLNGSPLKEKYPHGHLECVEYLKCEEDRRGNRFINQPKQYLAIHKILKAGFGFDKMDKSIRAVEKRYGPSAWDYLTLANWLEKGAANG